MITDDIQKYVTVQTRNERSVPSRRVSYRCMYAVLEELKFRIYFGGLAFVLRHFVYDIWRGLDWA